jgi:ferredoxin
MKVKVDLEICESHGECGFVAPDVFELNDDDVLVWNPDPDESLKDKVLQAAAVCPTQAITVEI